LGHYARECTFAPLPGFKPRPPRTVVHCRNCGFEGHRDIAGQCPYRKAFAPETVKSCLECGSQSHHTHRCPVVRKSDWARNKLCPICLEAGHWVDTCQRTGRVKFLPKAGLIAVREKLELKRQRESKRRYRLAIKADKAQRAAIQAAGGKVPEIEKPRFLTRRGAIREARKRGRLLKAKAKEALEASKAEEPQGEKPSKAEASGSKLIAKADEPEAEESQDKKPSKAKATGRKGKKPSV
jgi:hypothetical protein